MTRRLAEAGRILGVALLDHGVWSHEGNSRSIRESHPDLLATAATASA